MLHSMKTKSGISNNHWLMLVLVLVAKDTGHSCDGLDPSKKHKIKKIRVNSTKVVFLDGKSYKTKWNKPLTPEFLRKIVGEGVLLKDDMDIDKHVHVCHYDDQTSYHETDENIPLGSPGRHTPSAPMGSAEMRMFNDLIKITADEPKSDAEIQSIIPNDSTVTGYDPEITDRCIRRKTLEIKLADNKKSVTMREFKNSKLPLGLVYKDDQMEYVLAHGESLRCIGVKSMLKDAMGISDIRDFVG